MLTPVQPDVASYGVVNSVFGNKRTESRDYVMLKD